MKKYDDETALKTDLVSKKNIESEKIKTTNVNVLLNRVRLDRKKTLQKKFFITLILSITFSVIAVFIVL
tara:strand:- start:591 stop:797 length:207 start_codon:yes stop_codon:yes gene_type:complete